MRNLLEITSILTFIIAFGALAWAGMGMMAGGEANTDVVEREARAAGAMRALLIAGVAIVLHLAANRARKRMD